MGLLDKTNPNATARRVLFRAIEAAICGGVFFFIAFKTEYIQTWKLTLPIWLLLSAFVGAIWEWQVGDESDEKDT
jgi:hypothetical protein